MSLFAELRRRNVIRMAGLYLVGAWLIVQIAETLLPVFDVPAWVLRAIILTLALGLLPALVFSWVFELTPEGLRREQSAAENPSRVPQTAQRMNRMIVVGLVGVIVLMAVERFWLAERPVTAATGKPVDANAATSSIPIGSIVPGIAVLPFGNLSSDPENAFFAGGIYEEVLTTLSRIGALRIISRTSMERIAEQKLNVQEIGERLGVSHVLEGSVRRDGGQIRVTVQLIEAASDDHVFAQNYDRKLDDVFAIQSEIALAIADQLELMLSTELVSDLSERPTISPAAYELYLRALEEGQTWRGSAGFLDIIKLLEPAVALDPAFLSAQVMLAEAYGRMYWTGADPDGSYRAKAEKLIAEIRRRWPERPEAALASAQFTYNVESDYASALVQFQKLIASLPNNVEVMFGISSCLKRLNRKGEFLQAARLLVQANPESPLAYGELLLALRANDLYDEGVLLSEIALKKFPDDQSNRFIAARLRVERDLDLKPLLELPLDGEHSYTVSIARFAAGDIDGAVDALKARKGLSPLEAALNDASLAELLRLAGRNKQADVLARSAFDMVLANIETPTPPYGMSPAIWYTNAAGLAALAGERETALRWLADGEAAPQPTGQGDKEWIAQIRSDVQLALGNAEAAFLVLQPLIDDERFMLAARPYYDAMYGDSPSYRAFMEKLATQ